MAIITTAGGYAEDCWYPHVSPEMSSWAWAHLVRCAEPDEVPALARLVGGLRVDEARAHAEWIIREVGGEVSTRPVAPVRPQDAWHHIPPTRPAPSPDVASCGPSAWFTVYRAGTHDLAWSLEEVDAALRLPARPARRGDVEMTYFDDDALIDRCADTLAQANTAWWRYDWNEPGVPRVQRYAVGGEIRPHVDRFVGPVFMRETGYWAPVPARALASVVMLRPAEAGGRLEFDVKSYGWHAVHLDPGDVVVFDPWLRHRVTPVEAGERVIIQAGLQDYR